MEMKVLTKINAWLSGIDLAITRRSTLDRIVTELNSLKVAHNTVNESPNAVSMSSDFNQRLDDLRKEILRHQITIKWEVIDFLMRTMASDVQNRTCPLCGHKDSDAAFIKVKTHCIFGGGDLLRHQCPACDVIFGSDKIFQLSNAELSQDYEWHYRVYDEGDSTEQELRAFHLLKPHREGAYLNYGAGGWSRSVQILRNEGWNVMAFEPHDAASSDADYVISSRSVLSSTKFDGIFSNNVLEHLRHPICELSNMRDYLKPGGQMSHATPCFEYLYEYTRFHLFFYLGRSRGVLARLADLSIKEFVSDGEFMCCVMEPVQS